MESLFTQIAPVLDQLPGSNLPTASANGNVSLPPDVATPAAAILRSIAPKESPSPKPANQVKVEDDVSESFGQLALDEHGHLRWIGGSSTMSLIQSFRSLTTAPTHRISPMEEDPLAPGPNVNKLYFPASVFFGKVHAALPGPEEVEYPERDLADKLVRDNPPLIPHELLNLPRLMLIFLDSIFLCLLSTSLPSCNNINMLWTISTTAFWPAKKQPLFPLFSPSLHVLQIWFKTRGCCSVADRMRVAWAWSTMNGEDHTTQ